MLVYVGLPGRLQKVKLPAKERERAKRCKSWLEAVNTQCKQGHARVYIPDVIIAEAFKVLAKWYYRYGWFGSAVDYNRARNKLRRYVARTHREMIKKDRQVMVHDEPVNRDVIIGVDRFLERMYKGKLNVQIVDLLLLSIAKYLMDFYDIPKDRLYILTCDRQLMRLTRSLSDVPTAIDPTEERYDPSRTFV